MPWSDGMSLVSGAKTANLVEFYVMNSATAGKNLVNSVTRTATLNGSAVYGSDAIGSYLLTPGLNDALTIANSAEPASTINVVYMLVFSRQGAASGTPNLVTQNPGPRINVTGGNFNVGAGSVEYGTGITYTTAALSTEFAVLFDVQNGKFYYTGGGASVSLPANNVNTGALVNLYLGNNAALNAGVGNIYIRAYARWSAATGISASDFQSIVNTPQQLVNQAITYTYSRPSSDVTTQWTPSNGTDHFALIDETTANDADYISATAAGQTDEVRLASMTAPQAGTDLLINYKVTGIVGSATVTMSLRQGSGGTLIATDTAKNTDNTYQLVVPAATTGLICACGL